MNQVIKEFGVIVDNTNKCFFFGLQEVTDLDTSSAYMLFYERKGVCETRYMPNITGRQKPDTRDLDEEFDSDLKKMCTVM